MSKEVTLLFVVLGLGVLLLYLQWEGVRDGFQGGVYQRCGVDHPPCPHPFRCLNGICRPQGQPVLLDRNPLPVVP
jgi:hypothetical protein